jgi:hypothetical protein
MDSLPFSPAADKNRKPILAELRRLLADCSRVWEVGAGTGQHAEYFAARLPWLTWQPTEHPDALPVLQPRCRAAALVNLAEPVALDITGGPWPDPWPDALYTANTLHIVAPELVEALFAACAKHGRPVTRLLVYGPVNYRGAYTSDSNARFDEWLKARDPRSGIRDYEWLDELARRAGYVLLDDVAMPANNRLLCWERRDRFPAGASGAP